MLMLITLVCGLLFGFGLALSEMTNPAVVIGFLDIFGHWNPSLIIVMAAAVSVSMLGYKISKKQSVPLLADSWSLPTTRLIDRKLLTGSALFGIGWGLSGYCPGPGLTAVINNPQEGIYFVLALVAGSALYQFQNKK
ncbi:DUF6691 family protein [Marinomonas pollencensis]|uniref:Sulphur transport domain-containing protein n=1 Tax=Marinomonas pollencensis TaxID=491954 RepID=A0A3E0DSQ4_9GAMM|nr:DUF6691 family protein [Marinomonas pollencensis]REG85513.1 hypothetical protein DFP81_10243 [Marinomonas pollencensis]